MVLRHQKNVLAGLSAPKSLRDRLFFLPNTHPIRSRHPVSFVLDLEMRPKFTPSQVKNANFYEYDAYCPTAVGREGSAPQRTIDLEIFELCCGVDFSTQRFPSTVESQF